MTVFVSYIVLFNEIRVLIKSFTQKGKRVLIILNFGLNWTLANVNIIFSILHIAKRGPCVAQGCVE